jgi:hypothetical protein
MFMPWLRKLPKRPSLSTRTGHPRKTDVFRPRLERLEDLTLFSVTNNWTGLGGDGLWSDAANWSLGVPAPGQDVVITNANNTSLVTVANLSSGATVDSITTSVNLLIQVNVTTVGGGSVPTGGLTLQNGAACTIFGQLNFDGGAQSIAGSGSVMMQGDGNNTVIGQESDNTLTIAQGVTVSSNNGVIGEFGSKLVNDGVMLSLPGLTIASDTFTNNGTLEADSGSFVEVFGTLTNYNATTSTLSGGTFVAGGPMYLSSIATIVTNASTITLSGVGSIIGGAQGDAINNSITTNTGTLDIAEGESITAASNTTFLNEGTLVIDNSGYGTPGHTNLKVSAYTQQGSGSTTELVNNAELSVQQSAKILAGTVEGTGIIQSSLDDSGTISPGTSTTPGELTITGNLTEEATAAINVKLIGSATPGSSYDQIVVDGTCSVAGTISVSELDNYVPAKGNSYQIISCTSTTGDFKSRNGYQLTGTTALNELFTPNVGLSLVDGPLDHFIFPNLAASTVAGTPINGTNGFQVDVVDYNNVLQQSDNTDQVSLYLNGSLLAGPVTVMNGAATFTNVVVTQAGTNFQMVAQATNVFSEPGTFSITPAATSQLVFTAEPTDTPLSYAMSAIGVAEEDRFNNVETSDNKSSVFLELNPGVGFGGPADVTVQNGVATFFPITIDQAATGYTFEAISGSFTQTSSPFNITPLDTTTAAMSVDATVGQSAELQASVLANDSFLKVNEGTVSFEVFQGTTQIGNTVTSGTVANGVATALFPLPLNQMPGTYTIEASYADTSGVNFIDSQSTPQSDGTLTVSLISTATAAANSSVSYSTGSQSVTLNAHVTSNGANVNGGTVTFTVLTAGHAQVGNSVTSGTVSGGAASAMFTLPAGLSAGTYTIQSVYNPAVGYESTTDATHSLTVQPAQTSIGTGNVSTTFTSSSQSLTLDATVMSNGTSVGEGTVTFTILNAVGTMVGQAVTSTAVSGGNATATYTLPANQTVGVYTIEAVYDPGSDYQTSSDLTHNLTINGASTTTSTSGSSVTFSVNSQSLNLSADVTALGVPVDEGSVTFTILTPSNTIVGSPVTSGSLANGVAAASYALPPSLALGTYEIRAFYNAGTDYQVSSDGSHTLTVGPAPTATAASNVTASFSTSSQALNLTAHVTNNQSIIAEGAVTFTLLTSGGTQVGSPVTSNAVSGGAASVVYTLPAGTAPGSYTIQAQFGDSSPGDYQSSADSTHTLLITAPTNTSASGASTVFYTGGQSVELRATVTSPAEIVNEGTCTFGLFDSHNNQVGSSVTSGVVANGTASVSFPLPSGTPAGTYSVQVQYNDSNPELITSVDKSHTLIVQPAATASVANAASATFNDSISSVPVTATVTSSAGPVNEGTVTFSVFNGSSQVGQAVTSATVNGGAATADIALPGGTSVGTYTIHAQYNDPIGNFLTSTNTNSPAGLSISQASTSTTVSSSEVVLSSTAQTIALQANIGSSAGPVNQGSVTFVVLQGASPLATPVTSGAILAGTAIANFTVPAGLPIGHYTIQATYNGSIDFLAGTTQSGTLTVDSTPTLAAINGTNTIVDPHNELNPLVEVLNATSPVGNSLTYTVKVLGDSVFFDLEQQYQFRGLGYNTASATAYVLQSNTNNSFGNPYYLIRPADGALFAYDGSGSYAHSFAGTAITTLGASVYTDPTLFLNAQPPVDYSTVYNLEQHYHFVQVGAGYYSAGASAFVLQAASNSTYGNPYYLLSATGGLFAYDGSGSYAHTFANVTPVATLDPNIYTHPAELMDAQASPSIYGQLEQLQQQYDLQEFNGSFYTNTYGNQAEWFYSPVLNQYGEHWYTLTPDGTFRAWEGYSDSATGATIASLPTSVYSNPTWLTAANAAPAPSAVTASVDANGNLSINSSNYVGSFRVVAIASDGFLSASQTALVTSTGGNPTINVQSNSTTIPQGGMQSVTHGSFPLTDAVTATGAPGDTVATSVTVSSYSLPFSLEQQYRFQGLGTATAGATAYVLQSPGNNSFGNPYYLLSSTGGVYAYDGSGSYAHTFANVTPLGTLGGLYYSDPSLLLNAQPPVNYSQLYSLQQQYNFQGLGTFTAGATAYVLQSSTKNSFGNPYYLLSPAGGLYAYDGSGSYAHTFANVTPVATIDPGVFVNPTLLTGAGASPGLYTQLAAVEQQYDLKGLGFNIAGAPAYVLSAPVNNVNGNVYYLLNANGGLYAYDGSGSYFHTFASSANLVATLDPSVYGNPTLLTSAKAPLAATGVSATIANGTLTINAPAAFVGALQLAVTATDGNLSTTQTFQVTSTDTAPTPATISAQTIPLSSPKLTLSLSGTDADKDVLTYSASAVAYSAEYALQQQYHFQGVGNVTTPDGVTAYVLEINGTNPYGNPYYLLSSTGGLYAYDGSGSFSHTIANSANLIARLSTNDYTTPGLLTNASPPVTSAAIQQAVIAPVGNQVTLNVTGLPIGTVFEVLVTVSDGAETTQTNFLVTVAP